MSSLPLWLVAFFLATVVIGLVLFWFAIRGDRVAMVAVSLWICMQSAIALSGFYLDTKTAPPHLFLAVAPPLVVTALLFLTTAGRRFIDSVDLKWAVLLHSIRILVEITLYALFVYRQVPMQMTFEAGNLDILAGVTAPLIWWAYSRGRIGRRGLLLWNSLALLSVLNAVTRAFLSAPFRFQLFAFTQPTIAILRFPFVLLPAFLVPVVLFCHFVIFRELSRPA